MTANIDGLLKNDKQLHEVYTVKHKIGSGCFGTLYHCVNKASDRQSVMKIEILSKEGSTVETLYKEYSLLKLLQSVKRVPRIYGFLRTELLNVLEMEPLNENLEQRLKRKKITTDELCDLGIELIGVLREVHANNVVHRDLKPQNIMFDKENNAYLVDFGISCVFHSRKKDSPKRKDHADFVGTPRYASLAAHNGGPICFKDDLQSLMYVLIHSGKGQLPWMNIKCKRNKLEAIGALKRLALKADLAKGLPLCFTRALIYLHACQDSERPDYDQLIRLLKVERDIHEAKSVKPVDPKKSEHVPQTKTPKASWLNLVDTSGEQPVVNVGNPSLSSMSSKCFDTTRVLMMLVDQFVEEEPQENLDEQATFENSQTLSRKLLLLTLDPPKLKTTIDRPTHFKSKQRRQFFAIYSLWSQSENCRSDNQIQMIDDWNAFYYLCLVIVLANMVLGWAVLTNIPVNYGRLSQSISKILFNPKLAWFLFEVPNLIWVLYFLLFRQASLSLGLMLFTVHYVNRDILYPLSLKTTTKVPLQIVLASSLFTFANGFLQCYGSQRPEQPNRLIQTVGLAVFALGMWVNVKSDKMLQEAKESSTSTDSSGKKKYVVVRGFLFDLISSPNYFGEIVEWFGYWMVCQNPEALLFALSTLDILTPAAIKRHRWNQKNIEGYPPERKAVIPYVV